MAEYKTKQKEVLLEYLSQTRDEPQSIEKIVEELKSRGEDLGKSTVYRLIKKLSDDGSVKYFSEGKKFLYQLSGGEECHHHLHMKCTGCGKLLHMDHEQSEIIIENIYGKNGFTVSSGETTLFGKCEECVKKSG
ncbi:MAG: transcriptional repressor [Clostridia bacterium]|nr:transcriptional repressor [Clostridia bacterium]